MNAETLLMFIHMTLMALLATAWFYLGRTWSDRSDRSDSSDRSDRSDKSGKAGE